MKSTIRIFFVFVCVILTSSVLQAQELEGDSLISDSVRVPKVIQFSGVLVEGDSLLPIPYSNVYRKRDLSGVISNNLGFFTLPAFEGDTIVFSNIGYKNQTFAIPLEIEGNMLSIVQVLQSDTIQIGVTDVYPWPASREELRKDLLALELADNNLARTQRNLDPLEMQKRLNLLTGDANSAALYAMNNEVLNLQSMGTAQNVNLLNPFAWAQFLSALRNGSLRRQ